MRRRTWISYPVMASLLSACSAASGHTLGFGIVIRAEPAPGAKPKEGVLAVSDTGRQLFAFGLLDGKQAGTSSYAGAEVPSWIRVMWKEGPVVYDPGTATWKGGKTIADHRVEVASRIPQHVLMYAAASRGRALRLIFRIADEGVLLAWNVQEEVLHPSGGGGWVFSWHGGDFPCPTSPHQLRPNCTDGPLEQAPWYNPTWIRK
jgi:hypothetical protein